MSAFAPDDREWFAPITLTGEKPVPKLVSNRASTDPLFFQPLGDATFRLRRRKAVDHRGINRDSGARIAGGCFSAWWHDDIENRKAKFAGKFEVALVVRRHAHDRAGAVTHQDVIGDPNGDALL